MSEPIQKIQFKRNKNPDFELQVCTHKLLKGEPFYDSVTGRFIIGDGEKQLNDPSLKLVVTNSLVANHVNFYVERESATNKVVTVGDTSIRDFAIEILPNFGTSDAGKVLMIDNSGQNLIWGSVESSAVGKAIANLAISTNLSNYLPEGQQSNLERVTCNISITNKVAGDVITYKSLKIGTTGYGSSDIVSASSGIITGENTYELTNAKILSETTKLYAQLEYDVSGTAKVANKILTISFTLNPTYFAITDLSPDAVTSSVVKSGEFEQKYDKSATHTYELSSQRAIYAYRSIFGEITTVNVNGDTSINQLGAFTKKIMNIDGKEYLCYSMNNRYSDNCEISFS